MFDINVYILKRKVLKEQIICGKYNLRFESDMFSFSMKNTILFRHKLNNFEEYSPIYNNTI